MKKRIMRLVAAAGFVVVLAVGAILAIPSEAEAAVPCGLSYTIRPSGTPGKVILSYAIRNCHNYPVRRQVDIRGCVFGCSDTDCQTICAGCTVHGSRVIRDCCHVYGLKSCN